MVKSLSKQFYCVAVLCFMLIQTPTWGHGQGPRHGHGHSHGHHDHDHAWELEGRIGVTSNLLDEGYTMTNDNPSTSAGFEAIYKDRLLLGINMDTIQSQFFKRFEARWTPMIGVMHRFSPETTGILSYRMYLFTGGNIAHQVGHAHNDHGHSHDHDHHDHGTKASDLNSHEIAFELEYKGFYSELSWMWRPNKLENSKDVLLRLGYVYEIGGFYLDGSVFLKHHQKADKQRFNHFQFVASYPFKQGFEPYAGFTIGGKDEEKHSISNKWFIGLNYYF